MNADILRDATEKAWGTELHSILPYAHINDAVSPSHRMQWYSWWIHDQIRKQPWELFSTLRGYDSKTDDAWYNSFSNLWQVMARYMATNTSVSINDTVSHLSKANLFQLGSDSKALINAKCLVFAVIGWQTMLYVPSRHRLMPAKSAGNPKRDGYLSGPSTYVPEAE